MLLSVKEAAKLLRVSSKTVYRWASAEKIPFVRAGNQYRFSRAEILAWAAESGRQPLPEAIREPETFPEVVASISNSLREGGIFYKVSGANPEEVIEELVSVINLPAGMERRYLSEALTARESLASTGVGKGIAIPHLRHPLPHIAKPSLSLAFLDHPVDWKSVDSEPVEIVFVLLSPSTRSHLNLLSRLTFAIREKELYDLLRKQSVRRDILKKISEIEKGFAEASGKGASSA